MDHGTTGVAGNVVVVLEAGNESGARLARKLIHAGHRVAVSGRHARDLVRIVHGYPSSRVLAVAADVDDPIQLARLLVRVRDYFGADRLYTVASPTDTGENVVATHLAMSS
jgi:NADP-dependent 3-hydroxy acid dehydrogenase YdfG